MCASDSLAPSLAASPPHLRRPRVRGEIQRRPRHPSRRQRLIIVRIPVSLHRRGVTHCPRRQSRGHDAVQMTQILIDLGIADETEAGGKSSTSSAQQRGCGTAHVPFVSQRKQTCRIFMTSELGWPSTYSPPVGKSKEEFVQVTRVSKLAVVQGISIPLAMFHDIRPPLHGMG